MARRYLVTLRLGRNLTQERLSALTGVPQPTISRLEREVPERPTLHIVLALADFFGVKASHLTFGPDPRKNSARRHDKVCA